LAEKVRSRADEDGVDVDAPPPEPEELRDDNAQMTTLTVEGTRWDAARWHSLAGKSCARTLRSAVLVPVEVSVARRQKKQAVHAHQPRKVTTMTEPPLLRALGETARLTAGLVHIIDGDDAAVQALLAVAGKPTFEHRVAQLRQDRIATAARTETENIYVEKGFTVLEQRPQWRDTTTVLLRYLRTADGDDAHRKCSVWLGESAHR
jgi:hypothetical protein